MTWRGQESRRGDWVRHGRHEAVKADAEKQPAGPNLEF